MAKPRRRQRDDDPLRRLERRGLRGPGWGDVYHKLLTIPVSALLGLIGLSYLTANMIFAVIYLQVGGVANARPDSLSDMFFFSVQTMATIGYGNMYPVSLAANVLTTIESVYGLLTVALSTGIVFARISRPTARVMFSRHAVVSTVNGAPALMFRAANQRRNRIVEAQISVVLLRDERTLEGARMRRLVDLELVRSRTPMFAVTWMVMHPIDSRSPLHGLDQAAFRALNAEVICSITGLDDTSMQTVHARHVYATHDVRWNSRLVDILGDTGDGRWSIDYSRFDDIVDEPTAAGRSALPETHG